MHQITPLVYALLLAGHLDAQTVLFVDQSASGFGNGGTWANAFNDLQSAIASATAGDEIWVADGIYKPDVGTGQIAGARTSTFRLLSNVKIHGGFPVGGGDGTFSARNTDPESCNTVLSGDLAADDGPNFANTSENAYHVVSGIGADATAVLDGFVITGANANGSSALNHDRGGGMTCFASSTAVPASPTIIRCKFTANQADQGAGIYVRNSGPGISQCIFTGNHSVSWGVVSAAHSTAGYSIDSCEFSSNTMGPYGSGAAIMNYQASPFVTNTSISSCSANFGGGISNSNGSSPTVENCSIQGCSASIFGGAVYNSASTPTFSNCDFISNTSESGAGIHNYNSTTTATDCRFINNACINNGGAVYASTGSSLNAASCFFTSNKSDYSGGAIYGYGSTLVIESSTFSSNSAVWGGAIYGGSGATATMTNVLFRGNHTTQYHGGAAYLSSTSTTMTNCAFVGNFATRGGALSNYQSTLEAANCSFHGNKATEGGGAVYTSTPNATTFTNCILWENAAVGAADQKLESIFILNVAPTFNHSLVQHFSDAELDVSGAGNLDGTSPVQDPAFMASIDPLAAPLASGDLRLQHASPVMNLGDNSANAEFLDLAGSARIQDITIDLGAYEGAYAVSFDALFAGLDPDGDENSNGYSNFTDYAAGRDPTIHDANPITMMNGQSPVVRQRTHASDIEVIYLKSSDLQLWEQMVDGVDYTVGGTETSGSQTIMTLNPSTELLSADRMFYRALFKALSSP